MELKNVTSQELLKDDWSYKVFSNGTTKIPIVIPQELLDKYDIKPKTYGSRQASRQADRLRKKLANKLVRQISSDAFNTDEVEEKKE